MVKPTALHQTIAGQIDNQKPAHLVPGKHVGMEVIDANTLRVIVVPTGVTADVRYDEGPDLYTVTVTNAAGEAAEYPGAYCDMLGDLIFGVDAQPATFPMVEIWTEGPDGQMEMQFRG